MEYLSKFTSQIAAPPSAGPSTLVSAPIPQSLPKHVAEDQQIHSLTSLYQQQLAELSACHSLLLADQERLAAMLAPHLSPQGSIDPSTLPTLDPRILLFKDGLDLRMQEFQEDCKRLQTTEKRLQRKIEQAAADYEGAFLASAGLADARVLKRLKEQQRVIAVQQAELDQVRFEKEVLEGENNRLKVLCVQGGDWTGEKQPEFFDRPNLHIVAEGKERAGNVVHAGSTWAPAQSAVPPASSTNWLSSLGGAATNPVGPTNNRRTSFL